MRVSRWPVHRPPTHDRATVPSVLPAQDARVNTVVPVVCSTPSAKISTLTGTFRPTLATKVAPVVAMGSPHTAVQLTDDANVTVTRNDEAAWLPVASVAVQVTIVAPIGNVE